VLSVHTLKPNLLRKRLRTRFGQEMWELKASPGAYELPEIRMRAVLGLTD
jgi:hypothetical protein